jgi:hypothetical protein
MRKFIALALSALTISGLNLALASLAAADQTPTTTRGPTTGKERLSDKASDEQRVDNCRVPAERRGSKPRPDCKQQPRAGKKSTS